MKEIYSKDQLVLKLENLKKKIYSGGSFNNIQNGFKLTANIY